MGIYQRILDLEINVVKFHRNFIVDLQPSIDESDKKLDILREYENIQKIPGVTSTETFISLEETFNREVPIFSQIGQ